MQLYLAVFEQRRGIFHRLVNGIPGLGLAGQQRGLQRGVILLDHGLAQLCRGRGQEIAVGSRQFCLGCAGGCIARQRQGKQNCGSPNL